MRPWDYDPELTADRLAKVAGLLALGRQDAVDRHDPSIGDDCWTRGVRAYRCDCHRITEAAGRVGFDWLSVVDPGKRFQFKIGTRPLRFWCGDPAQPTRRVSCPTPTEQLRLDLGESAPLDGVLLRIGVVPDEDGALLQAFFVALLDGVPETVWPIPFDRAALPLVALGQGLPEGRELPPPAVGLHEDDEVERERRA